MMNATAESEARVAPSGDGQLRSTVLGFAVAAALFGTVDGYLIGGTVAAGVAGALLGGFIGAGLALLAWRPLAQDRATARVDPGPHPNYVGIWGVLFALTAVEVMVAFVALSKIAIILALVALAMWKALLVALYYMHLKFEPRRMWILAAVPLPLAVILVWTVLYEGW
jgi:cytochrome c oxidase subunit 4